MSAVAREPRVELLEGEDVRVLAAPLIRLEFHRIGESWTHRVVCAATSRPLASAVEPDPARDAADNLAGPVFQDVNLDRAPNGVGLALAVGRFGSRHFAASFRLSIPEPDESGYRQDELQVDLADRGGVPSEGHLAATYAIHAPPTALSWASEAGAAWEFPDGTPVLTFEKHPDAGPDARFQLDEAGRAACHAQVSRARDKRNATTRLLYSWFATAADRPRGPRR